VLGYLETWKGTFSGLDSGSWQVWIYTDGTIQGEAFSNDLESNLSVTGRYDFQGNFLMTATYGNTSAGATFTGVINISTGVVSGNWVNNYYEEEYGTFSGNRQ
jgi:hypothetical protein